MPESLPRPLVALTVIVALIAISVGVKDYVDQKKAAPQASTSAATATPSNTTTRAKKNTSTRAKRARTSNNGVNGPAITPATADALGQQLIRDEFANAGAKAKTIVLAENDSDRASTEPGRDDAETAMDPGRRGRNGLDAKAMPGLKACLPLPNLTEPGDIDAAYYENWAREYCGI